MLLSNQNNYKKRHAFCLIVFSNLLSIYPLTRGTGDPMAGRHADTAVTPGTRGRGGQCVWRE